MPRFRLPRPFAAIAVASAVACGTDPIVLCACSIPAPYTLVYGNVTDPTGAPVPDATVRLESKLADCQTASESVQVATNAAGRYRLHVIRTGTGEQCVRVAALAPPASGWRNSDTVQFSIPPLREIGADSVRRDIALRTP
ncbi:MAG TPA: carboxypeptidase-like regulatory domain-containing protein [Longimicrobium sp.]|nr:carboxypeptidase-like regulatory domain-containing protein [Longimicrobium sp.]